MVQAYVRDIYACMIRSVKELAGFARVTLEPGEEKTVRFAMKPGQIVVHTVTNLLPVQFVGKKVMSIHIKLKAERRPCWDAQIAEAKFFVNKIKIVVETFALVEL